MNTQRFVLIAGLLTSLFTGCSDDIVSKADQYTDCVDICNRYKDCADKSYDTDKCEDSCQDNDHHNGTSDVDACEDCLDNKSCTSSAFACATECAGIVP